MTRLEFQQMLGDQLRLARKAKGLSQRQVADKLGVSGTAVSFWESGIHPISTWTDYRLRFILGDWRDV